jgi:hypothetical protein
LCQIANWRNQTIGEGWATGERPQQQAFQAEHWRALRREKYTHTTRIGIRRTIGDVSENGWQALRLAIAGAHHIFGESAAHAVCVNSVPPKSPEPGSAKRLGASTSCP